MSEDWQDISEKTPRDGTLLLLIIEHTDDSAPLEDTDKYSRTVGFNNFDNDGEDIWYMAGWCWEHDHFIEGDGTVVKWMLFPGMDNQHVDEQTPMTSTNRRH